MNQEEGKTLWNTPVGERMSLVFTTVDLEQALRAVREEGTAEVDRLIQPYQTPVTLETLLSPVP